MVCAVAACETISCFARGAQPGPSNQERFQHALMTWQHPDTSLPAAAVSALTGSKSSQVLDARKSIWQEAFRSLFMALRSGACSAFYFATAEVSCSGGPLVYVPVPRLKSLCEIALPGQYGKVYRMHLGVYKVCRACHVMTWCRTRLLHCVLHVAKLQCMVHGRTQYKN